MKSRKEIDSESLILLKKPNAQKLLLFSESYKQNEIRSQNLRNLLQKAVSTGDTSLISDLASNLRTVQEAQRRYCESINRLTPNAF